MQLSAKSWTLIALALCIALAPLAFPSSFYYRIGAVILVNGLAVTGLVILFGYAGQISLGHAGFAGIGGYSAALIPVHLEVHPVFGLLAGAVISGVLAFLIGRPVLRLKGYYLAVATLGFGILVFIVLNNEANLTGGPDGMGVESLGLRSLSNALGLGLNTSQVWYWFMGVVVLLGAYLALNLHASPSGRALRSLHDSEVAAGTLGVDVARYKLTAFVISAVYASLAGSFQALLDGFITPDIAGFLQSIEWMTMTVLGGAATVLGAIFGAGLLTALPQALTVFAEYEHMALGLIMMLVMIFLPSGLLPSLARQFRRGG
ncbi:MAG: branched-chain amino acid ABC transporter permease [Rhodospirillaceae bacterium]|nr:branched-chain amino acid ABC transporter permease [Rhodospirillaceae bacterium]MCA8930828.1 branched-chain amino acid ABC transporter permease [Rhodospirillaceae bacterium]